VIDVPIHDGSVAHDSCRYCAGRRYLHPDNGSGLPRLLNPQFGHWVLHVTGGKVQSAVLRVRKTSDREQYQERELQQLEGYAVGNGKTCLIATVDAAQPDANAAAAWIEEAVRASCVSP
jgi:hypothetical protein